MDNLGGIGELFRYFIRRVESDTAKLQIRPEMI